MSNTVNIILKSDIIASDGYEYKAKSMFENVPKFENNKKYVCYEPKENHIIVIHDKEEQEQVIELGFLSSEIFKQLKSIQETSPSGVLDVIEEMERTSKDVENLKQENSTMREEIEKLSDKVNDVEKVSKSKSGMTWDEF